MAVTGARIEVDDLTFGYGRTVVGEGVSLACGEGEVLALLGPNGSGKTTLFKTVLGLLPALSGRVRVDGEDTRGWSPARRARNFGYVPQVSPGYFPFTVVEVVLMGRTARIGAFSSPSANDRRIAAEVIGELGLAPLAKRAYTEISGGERQLVLIARALAQEPRVLVLDEPTASLDFGNQIMVVNTIRRLAGRRLSIILSTHHPDQAFACASLAALLKAGRLIGFGPTRQVMSETALMALYDTALGVRSIDCWTGCIPLEEA